VSANQRNRLWLFFMGRFEVAQREGATGWIEEGAEGLTVAHLAGSKTDQAGEGDTIGIPYGSCPETCPVKDAPCRRCGGQ
jgi:hypothetical protein